MMEIAKIDQKTIRLNIQEGQVTLNPYAQISEIIRGNLIAKIIFRYPLLHNLEFAEHSLVAHNLTIPKSTPSSNITRTA